MSGLSSERTMPAWWPGPLGVIHHNWGMLPTPRPSRGRARGLVLIAISLAALPLLALRPVSDPSPWLHLKVGRFLLDGQRFGLPDPWAPFASAEYVPTQWLPSMLSAELYDRFGAAAIAWERAAAITVLALALVLWASRIARPWVAASTTALAVLAAWPSLTERPQLAGFVLLVPVLAAWWQTGYDHRPRWWLVPLTWVAASTHGVWAMGLALGGLVTVTLFLSQRLARSDMLRLTALLGACLAAAACTPVGPRLLLTPGSVGSQGRQFVQEWMPSSVRSPFVMAALAMLTVAWLIWISTQHRPESWQLVLLLAGFGLVLSMERTVAVGAIVAVPLLCGAVETALSRGWPSAMSRLPWRLCSAAAAVGIVAAIPLAAARTAEPIGLPTALEPQLGSLPAGSRILVDGDASGWLMFSAPHLHPVFDLRIESYSAAHVKRYIAVMDAGPGWDNFIGSSNATAALIPIDAPVRSALTEQLRWVEIGSDSGLVLLRAPA